MRRPGRPTIANRTRMLVVDNVLWSNKGPFIFFPNRADMFTLAQGIGFRAEYDTAGTLLSFTRQVKPKH